MNFGNEALFFYQYSGAFCITFILCKSIFAAYEAYGLSGDKKALYRGILKFVCVGVVLFLVWGAFWKGLF